MVKKLDVGKGNDIIYLEGTTIYTKEHPANRTLKKEEFEVDEVYIPEDVLNDTQE